MLISLDAFRHYNGWGGHGKPCARPHPSAGKVTAGNAIVGDDAETALPERAEGDAARAIVLVGKGAPGVGSDLAPCRRLTPAVLRRLLRLLRGGGRPRRWLWRRRGSNRSGRACWRSTAANRNSSDRWAIGRHPHHPHLGRLVRATLAFE